MCPLCGMEFTLQTLQKHLGCHLQEVALFALPRPECGEGSKIESTKVDYSTESSDEHLSKTPSPESELDGEQPPGDPPIISPAAIDGIRCICGYQHDDGFLVTCATCKELQHGVCMGIDENNFPEVYECSACIPGAYHLEIETAIYTQESFLKSTSQVQVSKAGVHTEVPPQTMVTLSIEAVRLVLQLFGLMIEGIEMYIRSREDVTEMVRHRTLIGFKRQLKMEQSVFNNAWYRLAGRADVGIFPNVELSPEIMTGALSFLKADAVKHFVDTCQELGTVLTELAKKFRKTVQNLVGLDSNFAKLYY